MLKTYKAAKFAIAQRAIALDALKISSCAFGSQKKFNNKKLPKITINIDEEK